MGEQTAISWADHTFNPWIGCARVSPACDGCYAAALMGGEGNRFHRADWGGPGKGVGTRVRTSPSNWRQPVRWNKQAEKDGTRPFVFCASLADVFDNAVDPEWRAELFALIRETPHLVWLLLTKRPQNIVKLFCDATGQLYDRHGIGRPTGWPSNAAIGCTVVSQEEADRDVPHLLTAKAALKPAFAFLSMEPLLGAVDLTRLSRPRREGYGLGYIDALRGWTIDAGSLYREFDAPAALDWVITGGETDQGEHKARPQHPDWFRSLRDQCAAAGVAYHHKQNGEWLGEGQFDAEGLQWAPGHDGRVHWWRPEPAVGEPVPDGACSIRVGKTKAGRSLDGAVHHARPAIPQLRWEEVA